MDNTAMLDDTTGDSGLDDLFEALVGNNALIEVEGETSAQPTEIIVPDEGDLEAAIASIPDEAGSTEVIEPAAEAVVIEAKGEPAVETAAPVKEPKAKRAKLSDEEKAKRAADRKAASEARKVEREAKIAEAKKNKVTREYFGNDKVRRMKATLGETTLRDLAVLTVADAALTGDDLTKRQDEVIAMIEGMSIKVKNRTTYLLEWLQKGGDLNNIMAIALRVLQRDGKIETGEKGNFAVEMLKRPYGMGTVRAAGVNTIKALKELAVLVPNGEKGVLVGNPDSLLLMKATDRLAPQVSA